MNVSPGSNFSRKVIYLDQNKWIQVARVLNGVERGRELEEAIRVLKRSETIVPLSHVHYVESARIRDTGKRERLGSVMWNLSKGTTFAAPRNIVMDEFEAAIATQFPIDRKFQTKLLGFGTEHAFGIDHNVTLPDDARYLLEKSLVTGEEIAGGRAPGFFDREFAESFKDHLSQISKIRAALPRDRWVSALYAITISDIEEPINAVLEAHHLSDTFLASLTEQRLVDLVDAMPTRKIDVHLHLQVLRNEEYRPKINDLGDWSGLGTAAMYCDVVICERHFADVVSRDGFQTNATIMCKLGDLPDAITET